MSALRTAWWQDLYDDAVADVLLVRTDEHHVANTVRFLENQLGLRPGQRVFDQCCGIGSLAIPLAARGLQVVGVDQAEAYVARARRDAETAGQRDVIEWVTGDAFTFVPSAPCHGAFNWWTSFGYAPDDATNAQMVQRAYDALLPGGSFALDFLNVPQVIREFQRDVDLRRTTPRGEVTIARRSEIDWHAGVMRKTWTVVLPDGTRKQTESAVRLYMPCDLAVLFARCGFTNVRLLGGVDGQPLSLESARCVVVARRPM